jgi:hypothetical protein
MTVDERIQWAIRFAGTNLKNNRAGDWLNLRDDLNRFLGAGAQDDINVALSATAYISASPDQEGISGVPASEDEIVAIQSDVRQALAWFSGPPVRNSNRPGPPLKKLRMNLEYIVHRVRVKEPKVTFSEAVANGPLRDCVLAVLLHLLLMKPGSPVELCPECEKVFYRQGKQLFCSRTCTNRAMIKRKRARDRAKEQIKRRHRKSGQLQTRSSRKRTR